MVIYAVYLDVYFIENLLLDILVLALTSLVWDKRLRWNRIIVAAIAGAVLATGVLVLRMQAGVGSNLLNLLPGLLILKIAFFKSSLQELIRGAMYFYTISFVFTKGYGMLQENLGEVHGLLISVGVMLIISVAIIYMKYCSKKEIEDVYYDVEILSKGKKVKVRALYDTGNVLTEPTSKKPVSIVEKSMIEEIWKLEEPCGYKCIPFQSVGKAHGMLMGIEVDALFVMRNGERIERFGEMIALYDGQLSADGSFRMILHQGLL